jgi:hypothetical protein
MAVYFTAPISRQSRYVWQVRHMPLLKRLGMPDLAYGNNLIDEGTNSADCGKQELKEQGILLQPEGWQKLDDLGCWVHKI